MNEIGNIPEDYTKSFYVPIGKGEYNYRTKQRGGYWLSPLEPPVEEIEPIVNQRQFTVTSLDLKWREREIKRLERRLDKANDIMIHNIKTLLKRKFPVTTVKIQREDLDKLEARQWEQINQNARAISHILKKFPNESSHLKRPKYNKYIL